jgi:multiple sugar transport system substrate-binding protein
MHSGFSRRRVCATLAIGGAGSVLAACRLQGTAAPSATPGAAARQPVTLSAALVGDANFWAPQWKLQKELLPYITVEQVAVPPYTGWGGYFEKLTAMIVADVPLDVVRVPIEGAKLAVAIDVVRPLDDFLRRDPLRDVLADIDANVQKPFQIRGRTWAIPWDFNTMVLMYNTQHFQEMGLQPPSTTWTYDDVLTAAGRLTVRSGDQVDRYGVILANGYHFQSIPWVFNRGASHLSDDWNRPTMDDPRFLSAIDYMRDLVWGRSVGAADGNPARQFSSGRAAMIAGGRFMLAGFKSASFTSYDLAPMPNGGAAFTEFGVGAQWMMKNTRQPDATWELLKFFASKESQGEYHSRGGAIAARRSVALATVTEGAPPNDRLFYQVLERAPAKPVPSPPDYPEMEAAVTRAYQQTVVNNEQGTRDAWAAAQAEARNIIARRPREWSDL